VEHRCLPLLSTAQCVLVGGYFIFASTTIRNPSTSPDFLWSFLLHLPCAVLAWIVFEEKTAWALLVYASVLFVHDFVVAGLYPGYELAFSIPLSIVDSFYIASAVVLLIYMDDEVKEKVLKVSEKMFQMFIFGDDDDAPLTSETLRNGLAQIRAYVIYFIQRTWILETGTLYALIIIMCFQLDGYGSHPWYQWFYVVHAFPIFAGAMCVFSFATLELSSVFLVASSSLCLVVDFFLIFFLVDESAVQLIVMYVTFIVIDCVNIVLYFTVAGRNNKRFLIAYDLKYRYIIDEPS
jgi:hypothetical protein